MSSQSGTPPASFFDVDSMSVMQRRLAVAVLLSALTMTVLDGVITNIALPTMARDFGVAPERTVWLVTTYQLFVVCGLLPFASLGEILGYRRIFLGGLAVFTLASGFCAMSHTIDLLTAGRALQGLSSAAVMSVFPALIRNVYPPAMFGRAMGFNALTVALASAMGPTVASAILAFGPWPWLFAVNLPIGLVALVLGWRVLPHVPRVARRFDGLSALLFALAAGSLVLGVDSLRHTPGRTALALAVVAVLGFWLVRRAAGQPAPLLPVDLLRLPPFSFAVVTSIATFGAQSVAYVALPFHLQHHFGRSQLATGLLMTAWPAAAAFSAPLAGRFVERIGAWKLCATGSALLGIGLFGLLFVPVGAPDLAMVGLMMVCGTGFGMFQTPNNHTLLLSAPRERSGSAGGMQGLARQLGMMTGSTTVVLSFGAHVHRDVPASPVAASALTGAEWALALGVGYALAGATISLLRGRYGEPAKP